MSKGFVEMLELELMQVEKIQEKEAI